MATMIGRNPTGGGGVVPTMPHPRRLFVVALLAVAAAGCASSGPGPSAGVTVAPASTVAASPAPSGPLVTVETRGGRCVDGPCGETIAIERDGRVHRVAPEAFDIGVAESTIIEALVIEIDQADYAALMSRPFSGDCPTAFDGTETIVTVATADGPRRLASCEVIIDQGHSLIVTILAAIESAGP